MPGIELKGTQSLSHDPSTILQGLTELLRLLSGSIFAEVLFAID